jgi:histidyl-tRNA synthetase
MRRADKLKASSVLIVGDDELDKRRAILRDMKSRDQREISFDDIETELTVGNAS